MKGLKITMLLIAVTLNVRGQDRLEALTVENIMRDPKWIGTSPHEIQWALDSKAIYFRWNPENAPGDSLYVATLPELRPAKLAAPSSQPGQRIAYNATFTKAVFEKNGDLFLYDNASNRVQQLTNTSVRESLPNFSHDGKKVFFLSGGNAFSWELSSGKVVQWTDFKTVQRKTPETTDQEKWLKEDQLELFTILRDREEKERMRKENQEKAEPKRPKTIFVGSSDTEMITVSPDERYITYRLSKPNNDRRTIVPNYVTVSGFTEDINARTKVGAVSDSRDFYIYDIMADTVRKVLLQDLPGMRDSIFYATEKGRKIARSAYVASLEWSPAGGNCVVVVTATDFKDQWIASLDLSTGKLKVLHREHDDAWVGGPLGGGFSNNVFGFISENRLWFGSEETGYSHIYSHELPAGERKALTAGDFEIQSAVLSRDRQFFYLVTNEIHPGEKHIYRMSVNGGKREQLTNLTGAHELYLSPDEKWIAFRYSYMNKPWELFVAENKPKGKTTKVTNSTTKEFASYNWREPQLVTFDARDGKTVHARVFRPEHSNGAGVVFVHGAGYLQNAHKWWSQYFREYMFHNLLTDKGYTVMDIDYRASAGYGRDWRTEIYRHMGGKDLEDNLDGAAYMVEQYDIDAKRIGVYGGSYGGFITLMAMFTAPDVFAAGAALRPVTDWAHYNHRYTGSILNFPYLDSVSYAKSSPIYFAEGLKGALLMCHGMVDTNVHFQDAVRLSQRLIELGKENWELAVYPVENHGFVEPSSWTDEYKRILKLFEDNLHPK
jgi:dipeptidyl aminopeptidase/acylaminoacyl peptidase